MSKSPLSCLRLRAWSKRVVALRAILLTCVTIASDRFRHSAFAGYGLNRRVLGLLFCLFVMSSAASAQTYPAPWPSDASWVNYTQLGQGVQDITKAGGDLSDGGTGISPTSVDVYNGDSGNLGSVYYYYDAINQVFFSRFRLVGNPKGNGGNVLVNNTWDTLIDIDGDGYKEFFIECNGNLTTLFVYWGDANQQDIPNGSSCASNSQGAVFSQAIVLNSTVRITDMTASGGGYLLDYQVPMSAFKDCSNTQRITATTPFSLAFSTSATTQNPTQKDFVGQFDFVMGTTKMMPFGDVLTLSGGPDQYPRVGTLTQTCGAGVNSSPITLTATTLDTLAPTGSGSGSTVIDTIDNVTFYYQLNGTSTWTQINSPVTTPVTGTVNKWSTSWVTSGLASGTYWIAVTVTDSQSHIKTNFSFGVNLANCTVVSNPNAVTAVDLVSFKASQSPDGRTLIEWQTGYEVGNLGFNLYRDVGGKRTRINPSLIGGTALLAGSRTPFTAGFAYAWIDSSAPSKALSSYWLEDLDASGKTLLHGPIFPISVSSLPPQAQSLTVSQLNHTAPGTTLATLSVARAAAASLPSRRLSSLSLQSQWQVAATNGAKLLIRKSGWYRVSQPQLVAAGFDVSKDPRFYQLFVDGAELPLLINGGQSGRLDPTDSIEFYAAALDSPTTTQRALFLTNGTQAGRRLPQLPFADGKPSARTTFTAVLDQRDRFIYVPSINNGDAENWFGAFIYSNPYDMPMSLSRVDPDAADPAVVEVALQGLGSDSPPQAHVVRVQVNGQEAGTISFSGTQHQVGRLSVSARLLKEGQNTVTLTGVGGAGDHSLLDWTRLSYPHRLVADENRLLMTARQDEQVQVSGFSTARVRVFDVTDEANPVELGAKVELAGLGYRVTATAQEVGERVLLVVGERAYEQAQVVAQVGSSWHESSQGADVVMVVGAGLSGALEPLVAMRKQQGYVVAVVEVEDAYDEFSYGQKTAQAVQDLVAATRQWKRVPKWLLLVGDASYDPKNYTELGDWDLVPTKAAWVNTMEAASDEWLGDVNGDGLAEVAVGRLPVRNVAQAQAVVAKIVGYGQGAQTDGALLVADTAGEYDFEAASNAIEQLMPGGTRVQKVYRRLMDDQTASQAILTAVNHGPKLVNYAGHGSASLWRGNLLTTSSVAQMTNGQALPVVVSMTCLNGMYTDPYLTSLGEALLLSGQGGAIAVWASSAQTAASRQAIMDQEFVRQLFQGVGPKGLPLTLGEAIAMAKAALSDPDLRSSWILLGDPLMRIQ